ncbi:endodeoxyribonuclease [Geranomyces variabilis]|uniref:DNA topoisomerase (ATP-hydrolyzing) n=1 Tax=Geranomyces variabilis TaxID=109894 RepID=A0AAD5TQC0_9FUNG|nr:endodeoxyribonuclease [Geranomyces variabilis]
MRVGWSGLYDMDMWLGRLGDISSSQNAQLQVRTMDDIDDGRHDIELGWKPHDRAAGSDFDGFSDPTFQFDASWPVDLHGKDSPRREQTHPVHSQLSANHPELHDSGSSTALLFSGDCGGAELDFADEDFDDEDADDFEQDHDAVQLSLFGSMDEYLLSTQQNASDLTDLPFEETSAGPNGWPDIEGSDPFDESGPSDCSLLRADHVPDVTDDVAKFSESPLDLDFIVSQAAAAESASLLLYRPHRGILVGDPASANLTVGSLWKTQQRNRQWLSFHIGATLDAIKAAWQDDALPVMWMLSRSSKAWICAEGSHTMLLRSRRWAHKRVPGETLRFDVYCEILRYAKGLLDANQTVTKREIFYRDVRLFKTQATVDAAVEDLACAFGVPRFCLRIVASAKGLVYGNLTGTLIPPTEQIAGLQTDARFVLVIEKDATFRTLLDQGFASTHGPCILVTGKGYPDVATRQLVRRLSEMKLSQVLSQKSMDSEPFASQPGELEWNDAEVAPIWDPDENASTSGVSPSLSPLFEPSSEPVSHIEPLCSERMGDEEEAEFDLSGGSSMMCPSADDGRQVQELAPTGSSQSAAASSQSNESNEPRIPALALVDCDPYGIEIFLCYKIGSESLAFDRGTLACPSLRWLGIRPTDWTTETTAGANAEMLLDSPALLPLTPHDRRKITTMLLRRPALRTLPDLKGQLSRMLRYNRKSEIQALEAGLLAHDYLPRRIAEEILKGNGGLGHVASSVS